MGIRTPDTLVGHTRFPIVLLRPARTSLHNRLVLAAMLKYTAKFARAEEVWQPRENPQFLDGDKDWPRGTRGGPGVRGSGGPGVRGSSRRPPYLARRIEREGVRGSGRRPSGLLSLSGIRRPRRPGRMPRNAAMGPRSRPQSQNKRAATCRAGAGRLQPPAPPRLRA